jgi:hypothetical protein
MLPATPTSSWLESNNPSLHQTQGGSKRRVAPLAIVEDLEVLEDGADEFHPGVPALAVEQFDLHPAPKGLDDSRNSRPPSPSMAKDPSRGRGGESPRRELTWVPWSE